MFQAWLVKIRKIAAISAPATRVGPDTVLAQITGLVTEALAACFKARLVHVNVNSLEVYQLDFETPFLLTQGGPANATENLILLSYRYTFGRNDVGLGSAVAILTLALLMVLSTIMMHQQAKSV